MSKKTSKKPEPETNLDYIIYPEDVTNNRDLKDYFRQRLGPDFNDLSFLLVDRDAYLRLLYGEHALLSQMIAENEDAANEIFLAYAGDKLNRVVITFNIETPTVGNRAVRFIKKHKTTEEHEVWLTEMEQMAHKLQKLHHQWKRQPFPFHKLPNPPKSKLKKAA